MFLQMSSFLKNVITNFKKRSYPTSKGTSVESQSLFNIRTRGPSYKIALNLGQHHWNIAIKFGSPNSYSIGDKGV